MDFDWLAPDIMVVSQTRFLLAYTGELTLAGGWRISDLVPSWCPEIAPKNAYTSSLRQNRW
jgi:hypothetical protein